MKRFFYFALIIIIILVGILIMSVKSASKNENLIDQSASVNTSKIKPKVVLPNNASINNPVVNLGFARDPKTGREVEGYAIVHYKKKEAKSSGGIKGEKCYGFLARDSKWRIVEPWLFNGANQRGLDVATLFNLMDNDIAKWEWASGDKDILGAGTITNDSLIADFTTPDNKNEIYFDDISDPNAIAVTVIWGIFSGPLAGRELVEWDQVYDDIDFDWSTNGEANKMDFENISTHELGHSVGLNDIYSGGCVEVTMYGYSSLGETKKRTLESADVAGVSALYK